MSTNIRKENITTAIIYKKVIPVPNTGQDTNGNWFVTVTENGQPITKPIFNIYSEAQLQFLTGAYYFRRRAVLTTSDGNSQIKYFDTEAEATDWQTANIDVDTTDYIDFEDDI